MQTKFDIYVFIVNLNWPFIAISVKVERALLDPQICMFYMSTVVDVDALEFYVLIFC
jgi:hypothetical protein